MTREKITHTPIKPPRDCTPGEWIFLKLWQDFVEARDQEAAEMFGSNDINEISQREASVAASFMVFMGCNGGYSFTLDAERITERLGQGSERGFLAAWALQNARYRGTNNGVRTIEYMLADAPLNHDRFGHLEQRLPTISMRDIDTVERMVMWWSSDAAAAIRKIAETLIEAERQRHRSGLFVKEESE